MARLTSIEICAGAGGQAIGLETAGFDHLALVENDHDACKTLSANRGKWNVIEGDVCGFHADSYAGQVDLLAGGVPCPPFSKAGKQLGADDERNLFPEVIRLARECSPKAIMIENVRGLLDLRFDEYRQLLLGELESLGYRGAWRLINAADHGVSQLRPRAILVAFQNKYADAFQWPTASAKQPRTVGAALYGEMASRGWVHAAEWRARANGIAPTLVGGSKKHGGPDLGPTRARQAWAVLGVDGRSVANEPPHRDFEGMPKLTVKMAAMVQGFPADWVITGKKTAAYRQVGNAFPPPVAAAVGAAIHRAILSIDLQQGQSIAG